MNDLLVGGQVLEDAADVFVQAGVSEHSVVGECGDNLFLPVCPVGTAGGDDHMIVGGAVIVRFDLFELFGVGVEGL